MNRKVPKRPRLPNPLVYDDGREVTRGSVWERRKQEVMRLDCFICRDCKCQKLAFRLEVHHVHGRGMAGSKRDDRIWVDGKRNLITLCHDCHAKYSGPYRRAK